jgi:hypothetical protein
MKHKENECVRIKIQEELILCKRKQEEGAPTEMLYYYLQDFVRHEMKNLAKSID